MKKILNLFSATLVCLIINQTTIMASSHREAPLISNDPIADNTDLYVFRSPCDTNKVVIIANYIPFEHPAGGPNWYTFGTDVRYDIYIDNNSATPGDDIIYRFNFKQENQDGTTFFNIRLGLQNIKTTYDLERSIDGGATFARIISGGVPPPNIGSRSIENSTVGLGKASYDAVMTEAIVTATTGERVYAGPVDDPFFVDLGGAFDVGGFRKEGRDAVAKFNCHSLVIEVPISTLQKAGRTTAQATSILDSDFIIGVYASSSRPPITTLSATGGPSTISGDWVQVSRLGMPLTNEAIIPIGSKDKWNATKPANDLQFAKFFTNPELSLYIDDSRFGGAVPGLADLRIQTNSLGAFDFRNGKKGLFGLKNSAAVAGTALADTGGGFGAILLPDSMSPRAVDLLPIFYTGVPNLPPYQLATGKPTGNPLAPGKPFINNFLPTLGDYLRLNMAVPVTPRNDPKFSSLGLVQAAVLGLTDPLYNGSAALQFIPNMDGFPNGRRLEDDVTTIELQAVGGVVLAAIGLWYDDYVSGGSPVTAQLGRTLAFQAGVTSNDTTFKACMPYLQAPWRGFTGTEYVGPKSNMVLPVTWTNFAADKAGQTVLLKWKVTNELNALRYDVEQSLDGANYTKIGSVNARSGGDNNYQLLHPDPSLIKGNFYRIKQIDKDGRFTYSPIRLIKFNSQGLITITPNPATSVIRIFSNENRINVNVFDQGGKKVATRVITDGNGEINVSKFAKGTYTVVVESNGIRLETKKIVKQ